LVSKKNGKESSDFGRLGAQSKQAGTAKRRFWLTFVYVSHGFSSMAARKDHWNMNVKAFAIASGLLLGVLLFLATLVEAARDEGHTLILLAVFFIGYSVSYLGSLVALVYGFISGALLGGAFAWLYNRFAGSTKRA
jgi:hypothetical protein